MTILKNVPKDCRLCHASLKTPEGVGDVVYGGTGKQKFYRCPECDVAFLYPPMNEEEEKRFYAGEFAKFMERRTGGDFDWSGPEAHIKSNRGQYIRRLRFFEDLIPQSKKVLEVGSSSGFMLFPLKEKGLHVTAIEPSGGFTTFLKSRDIDVYDSLDSLEKTAPRERFDLIMHFFVLEHIRDPEGFLKRLIGFLSPGGAMVFEVPSRSDPLISIYDIPAFQRFYWSVAHNFYFNRNSLEYLLKNVTGKYEIIPEQRYDLSNHLTWALEGRPGGQGKYSGFFTQELEKVYKDSMMQKGHCDTVICRMQKGDSE